MQNLNTEQPITQTLEENYMPYAMSVIISRAIPEIDGFKPSHRKLLYTMYKMGLLTGNRTKSANVVGQTMKLNPHGDSAIYETMVRLSRGYEALLHPYVDSKGNFGKVYSRDMAYAASRYTEVKLDPICSEIFKNIDKDTVDFVPNYDNTQTEPTLLPVTFPNILVNPNQGIAVGMASNICPFNLEEICNTTIELINNPDHLIESTLKAPDFPTGGILIFSHAEMKNIYETGKGSFKIRAKYNYVKKDNCIEITEIPYTTTVEAIMDKIIELVKSGSIKEISDVRDETDLSGLKLTIDLKRGVDPDVLMTKLYKLTPLEDSFACNFNILIAGMPRVMGIKEILNEWIAFRTECIKRETYFNINKKREKLHLLIGLKKILLDIDKAIKIIRDTEDEAEVVPNLMIGFGIDEKQAEFIAEIKLRNLNREHVLKRISEVDELKKEIEELEDILANKNKLLKIIVDELTNVKNKFKQPRKTEIVFEDEITVYKAEEHIEDYPVTVFITREGYFKKITPQSLRMSGEQKLKEGDSITQVVETTNKSEILVFTDQCQVYKAHLYDFEESKASLLGDFLPAKLSMDEGENVLYAAITNDYNGYMLFFFEDGRAAKIDMSSYETKTNRKKLTNAYSGKSPLVAAMQIKDEIDCVLTSTNGRILIVNTGAISPKTTRDSMGIKVMTLKSNNKLKSVKELKDNTFVNPDRYKTKNIPAAGSFLSQQDKEKEQLMLE